MVWSQNCIPAGMGKVGITRQQVGHAGTRGRLVGRLGGR